MGKFFSIDYGAKYGRFLWSVPWVYFLFLFFYPVSPISLLILIYSFNNSFSKSENLFITHTTEPHALNSRRINFVLSSTSFFYHPFWINWRQKSVYINESVLHNCGLSQNEYWFFYNCFLTEGQRDSRLLRNIESCFMDPFLNLTQKKINSLRLNVKGSRQDLEFITRYTASRRDAINIF